mmetsp:Transcript_30031/g.82440  ORF Transcript_30031/g.82440 Transcript_30031/m.82440 type:complete len:366 (-) Transcript_30031:59-1156(-)|eukprot:CAMPEP_0168738978 /NCGR_PEP_ID=MMETSP0724-20121128/11216_1 /TAXON_ID=265536 /ORGANISM="Amphiprora sp., Strain CCMP467" /LENGTH=365 /DNA_ID=CAMNT_0008786347 /DNA_START=36 /DNA_END=1133 /DNA_ORIENTATION=+
MASEDGPIVPEAKALPNAPSDCISKLQYLTTSLLASSSWDGSLRLHDVNAMESKLSHSAGIGPLISLAAVDEEYIFVGGLNGSIMRVNVAAAGSTESGTSSPAVEKVGVHSSPNVQDFSSPSGSACSCLAALPASPPLVASAGWHGKLHLWDLRTSSSNGAAVTMNLPGKAFTMDTHETRIVVGCSGRRTCLLDVRRSSSDDVISWTAETVFEAESSQKHQTRCVKFFPDGQSIAVGSVEGRVAVESVASVTGDTLKKLYAFKCHRDGDLVYPVNCIAMHPKFGTFATGGCDSSVVTWDGENRKRLTSFKVPTSVAAICFNHDGSQMAVASSYTFEDGEREHPRDEIYIRQMLNSEVAPKTVTVP